MAGEEILNASANTLNDLVIQVGSIGRWMQALGLVVVLWIIIQIINWIYNLKRLKKINKFEQDIERIEKKIDKISLRRNGRA